MVRVSDWYELRDPQMVTTYCIHVTLFWCLPPLTANLIIPPISYFAHHLLPFSPLSASNFWICVTHCVGISDLAPSDVKCSYLEEKNSIFKFSFDGKASCRYSVLWYMGVSTSNIFFLCHPHSPRGGGALGLKLTAGAAQNRGAKKWPLQWLTKIWKRHPYSDMYMNSE